MSGLPASSSGTPAVRRPLGILRRAIREFSLHDYLVIGYAAALNVAALSAPTRSARAACLMMALPLFAWVASSVFLVRSGIVRHPFGAPLLYRLAIYGTVQLSYFLFANFLPLVNSSSLDQELYAIDLGLFGFEPALSMDSWVTAATTEWFAFFYFGYFFLLAVHVLGLLFFARHERILGEFCLGVLTIFCVGHIIYMLVPGWGPYRVMADEFQHVFPDGAWVDMVMATVASGGAQKDIFPSLHTAAPTFIALFSYRNRHVFPFRYSWVLVVPFTANIIVATMFLRWHYIIDVVAGLALATTAFAVSVWGTDWELARRRGAGLSRNWPEFFPATARPSDPPARMSRELTRPHFS
ncbi:MAG TPA: phosphatase PAP2 family protein [Polyangiaceae bacterium]